MDIEIVLHKQKLDKNYRAENFFCTFVAIMHQTSNKEVIGSTEVNLRDFLRPNIYYKIEMKVIFTEHFSLI